MGVLEKHNIDESHGLKHAIDVLSAVPEISFNFFNAKDVVRHPIVQRIVQAYEAFEAENPKANGPEQREFRAK